MKTFAILLLAAAMTGCTTTSTTTTAENTRAEDDPTLKRAYSKRDLEKTGHPDVASGLEKVDPSVRISSGGR